ncbi:hypothetical protein NMK71_11140 [Weeksellaceae bacterium KMM 9713]|uniref:Uncharacterized protein n=1 Tax=Profundicola chukchiensis TaxID=2961959 RepID=A0A9X4N102_9FLAO|nr:hypothetical protein [Profundicola chukchiensis]MDG4946967.1 hypothetical protein [Profundicola chukchiensis]
MKRILIFSLLSFFTFSCTEYNDDGLPSEPGNIVITNPDGTKKVKQVVITMDGSFEMATEMPMDIQSVSTTTFATDSYSRETSTVTTYNGSGEGQTIPDTSTETWEGRKFIQMQNSSDRVVFSYNEDQLIGFNSFNDNSPFGSGEITATENEINLITSALSPFNVPTNTVFTLENGYISAVEITNTEDNSVYNIDISRSNANITQLVINSPVGSKTYNYTYDANINPMHLAYETPLQQTYAEIARLITSNFNLNIHEGNQNINSIESSFRMMLSEGNNNLLSAASGNERLFSTSISYDDENYPIASTGEGTFQFSLGGILDGMIESMTEMMEQMDLSQEEIDEFIANTQEEFSNGVEMEMSTTSEISYYE